jgi:hypothetical protein
MWRPDLPQLLAEPLAPLSEITAHHDDLPAPLTLPWQRWQLAFDETRAPRCTLRVDVPALLDPALDAALDPRTGVRLHLRTGHRIHGEPDRVLVADVGLRRRDTEDPAGTCLLDAAGDEALVIDNAPCSITSTLVAASTTAAMTEIIDGTIPGATVVVTVPTGAAVNIAAPNYRDKQNTLDDLADRLGDVDVYDDGLRAWWITERPTLADEAVLDLEDGAGGTLVSLSSTLDREDWYNRVVLRYEWRDAAGDEHTVQSVRSVTSGPYAATAGNVRAYETDRDVPATQAQADAAATSLLRRLASRGRTLRVRAVSVPWLRPGMTVRVAGRTGPGLHVVARVTFDSAGWMELETRYPDNDTTIGA